ncbi:hypothetical protein [Cohnella caldifontis]|uniref:hypothetical protein n=1 Tax=Cohnella caldifontis TaxID=3027471 RepID=UPI0023EC3562|nr:hypothetical protein [Cohnella sp. YIM B05605]
MLIANLAQSLVCAGALWTLKWMGSPFRRIEKIVLYLVCVTAFEQAHSAILDSQKLIRITPTGTAFAYFKMNQLILFPLATMWLLYAIFRIRDRFLVKAALGTAWMAGLTASVGLSQAIGVIEDTGWNVGYAVFTWTVVLLAVMIFAAWYRKLLEKRGEADAVRA